jgi:glycosyltransferase involved in cell wall biosynthesis
VKEKLLTVSIAAYNVEQYLRQALESLVVPETMDEIEVLIVNDGSADSTSAIGHEFEKKYPETFRVIDKENGGYGTTVNRGISEARGVYFRLLDGDDWFDREGLLDLVQRLHSGDADVYLTPRYVCREGSDEKTLESNDWYQFECRTYGSDEMSFGTSLGMWFITVKTDLLRSHPFDLPAHTLYTDQIFTVRSLAHSQTFQICPRPLYCYRVGREGQSVSRESRIKHIDDQKRSVGMCLDYLATQDDLTEDNRAILVDRVARYYNVLIKTLLLLPASKATWNEIKALDAATKSKYPDVYSKACQSKKFGVVRFLGHIGYWPVAMRGIDNWE